jgi:hypothetical protein
MSNQQDRQVATPFDAPVLFFAYENNAADPSGKMLIYHLSVSLSPLFQRKRNGITFTPFFVSLLSL